MIYKASHLLQRGYQYNFKTLETWLHNCSTVHSSSSLDIQPGMGVCLSCGENNFSTLFILHEALAENLMEPNLLEYSAGKVAACMGSHNLGESNWHLWNLVRVCPTLTPLSSMMTTALLTNSVPSPGTLISDRHTRNSTSAQVSTMYSFAMSTLLFMWSMKVKILASFRGIHASIG